MNEDTAARVARVVASIRSGVYVSRQTMQDLLADIHDAHDSDPQRGGNPDAAMEIKP